MFYPQEMTQTRLIIPAKDLMTVTKELANLGVFHQANGNHAELEKKAIPAKVWVDRASSYFAMERRIVGIMTILGIPDTVVPATEWSSMTENDRIQPVLDRADQEVRKVREQLSVEEKRLEQLESIREQLEPIADIDINLTEMHSHGYIYSILGIIPIANIDRLRTSLERIPFVFIPLRDEGQRSIVWLAGSRRNADVLDRAARSAYLNPLVLPENYQGTPAQILASLRKDMDEIHRHIDDLNKEIARLRGEWEKELIDLLSQVRSSRILAEAIGRFNQFRYTYVITGWVPSSKVPNFSEKIKDVSPDILIETSPYKRGKEEEEENVPVALRNPRIIRPFQGFVMNYARPQYGEIDPTFLLAIAFPFMFGAMFGDVGQGLLLALLGWLLSSGKVKALKSMAGLGGVVLACGISATIFGFLYGSIFGFEDVLHPLIFSPITNIMTTLAFAIAIGMVLLSIGFIVSILNSFTEKNWGHLLFEPHGLAGLLLYWSLLGLAIEVIAGKYFLPPVVFGLMALISGLAVMFSEVLINLLEGHRPLVEEPLFTYGFRSFFELFEVLISLLSNSVSFVRIGAFAVAHVGLTSVILILAALISPSHGIGYWIVVAFGNLFIIGFEGMIVGIQTMRLSYYEFFSKFFKGGGERYNPLSLKPSVNPED